MPLPAGYLPREGDVLILHAVVKYDVTSEDEAKVFVRPVGHYGDIRIDLSVIVGLYARKWEPGELARLFGNAVTVVAVDDDQAWIKLEDGTRQSVHVNELEPVQVDPVERPFAEAPIPSPSAPDEDEVKF